MENTVRQLSPPAFWTAFALVFGVFLVVDNPVFGNPFDVDGSILWSYLPIPALVLVGLVLEKKLSLVSWFLDTLRLTCVKFALTTLLLVVLWMIAGEPPR